MTIRKDFLLNTHAAQKDLFRETQKAMFLRLYEKLPLQLDGSRTSKEIGHVEYR